MASDEKKTCVPCCSLDSSALLPSDQVDRQLQELNMWKREVKDDIPMLCWQCTAKNFQSALDAINAMGKIAERENHHPDFHLTNYRNLEVRLWSHKLNGITQNDIELAKMISREIKIVCSPKWLKEHPEAEPISRQS
jgi:4a-hydroxytetrahydrobiopterin dehydratase